MDAILKMHGAVVFGCGGECDCMMPRSPDLLTHWHVSFGARAGRQHCSCAMRTLRGSRTTAYIDLPQAAPVLKGQSALVRKGTEWR